MVSKDFLEKDRKKKGVKRVGAPRRRANRRSADGHSGLWPHRRLFHRQLLEAAVRSVSRAS
ncbi:MAG: hypothetical protein IKS62_00710 [Aeriscardovia sp.]|nr:hypothetical protein [Aeriscardovia sp.]